MLKTSSSRSIKRRGHEVLRSVREHYLRDDIPCNSPLCETCRKIPLKPGEERRPILPESVTHYVIPDGQATIDYMELFLEVDLGGLILTQTSLNLLRDESSQRYHRLRELTADPQRGTIVFSNEASIETFIPEESYSSTVTHRAAMIHRVAQWYHGHLNGQIPVVIISDDSEFLARYACETVGVLVMPMQQYLENFHSQDNAANELYRSLRAALDVSKDATIDSKKSDHGYTEYLSAEAMEAGVKSGVFSSGILHVNRYHQHEATVNIGSSDASVSDAKSSADTDVLVLGDQHRNRAVHGDLVVVELLSRSNWGVRMESLKLSSVTESSVPDAALHSSPGGKHQPTGRVVGVLRRNWRNYVVTLQESERDKVGSKVLGIPLDRRIPKIRFATSNKAAIDGQRIVVRIHDWQLNSRWPEGHFIRTLGMANKVETESAAILIENDIRVPPWSEKQLEEMPIDTPERPWRVDPDEAQNRLDLRDTHLVFSIDPAGCEDVDDALGVKYLKNGNIELSVHIADVSYFVAQDSLTDLEARERGTTVYLCDRRYDMLPEVLSANLCSLLGGKDRYAMSVIWELSPSGDVLSTWFGRTVICSAYQLDYELAQNIGDGLTENDIVAKIPILASLSSSEARKRASALQKSIKLLMDVARRLNKNRVDVGALELESDEIRVQLNSKKGIEALVNKGGLEIHATVAECMIFANRSVAEKISHVFPNGALLRRHPLPDRKHFDKLTAAAAVKGFSIDVSSNFALARSLDSAQVPGDPEFNRVLRTLATAAMAEAEYFDTSSVSSAEWFHYGLGLDHYTHFTSPIRRYADIIVHRQLLAAVASSSSEFTSLGCVALNLRQCAQHINMKNRTAKEAQKQSLDLFISLYFSERSTDRKECTVEAVVVRIKKNGVIAYVPRFGLRGPVYLQTPSGQLLVPPCFEQEHCHLQQDPFVQRECNGTIHFNDTSVTVRITESGRQFSLKLFDRIKVWVSVDPSPYHISDLRLNLLEVSGSLQQMQNDRRLNLQAVVHADQSRNASNLAAAIAADSDGFNSGKHFGKEIVSRRSIYDLFNTFSELAIKE